MIRRLLPVRRREWRFDGLPESATACNCTACRRYGVLWAYDYEGEGIQVSVRRRRTSAATRSASTSARPAAASRTGARCSRTQDGRRRIAVNLRLTEPEPIAPVPIEHFDGLGHLRGPRAGRSMRRRLLVLTSRVHRDTVAYCAPRPAQDRTRETPMKPILRAPGVLALLSCSALAQTPPPRPTSPRDRRGSRRSAPRATAPTASASPTTFRTSPGSASPTSRRSCAR